MDSWNESVTSWLADHIVSAAFGFLVAAVIGFLFGVPQFRKLRARIDALEEERSVPAHAKEEPVTPDSLPKGVDCIGAWAIVDRYIEPALRHKRDPIRLAIRRDFLEEFDKVTGAKLGEHIYNRALLHQWMESNAARFLVENRGEMR